MEIPKFTTGIVKNELEPVSASPEDLSAPLVQQWMENSTTQKQVEGKRDCRHEIEKVRGLIALFETTFSLDDLNAITDLSYDPDRRHPLRDPAKIALRPIYETLQALRLETNIPENEYDKLHNQAKILSNAVGFVNNGRVRHS